MKNVCVSLVGVLHCFLFISFSKDLASLFKSIFFFHDRKFKMKQIFLMTI